MSPCLNKLRERIDRIDEGLVELLAERMECAEEVIRYKKSVRDEARELEVLERIQRISRGRISRTHAESVFRKIIQASVELQRELLGGEKQDSIEPDTALFSSHRIAVAGTGGMGSWLANSLSPYCPVAVYDTIPERMKRITGVEHLGSISELEAFNPTLFANAVNLESTEEVFREAVPFLSDSCVLLDIMSVKGTVRNFYREIGRPFVSIHPMFGPVYSNMADLSLENAVIISESDRETSVLVEKFLKGMGVTVHFLPFEDHDREMAKSLTLPFAASIVFAASLHHGGVPGTTFTRHKLMARRLFMESDYLLTEVLFNSHSRAALNTICTSLEYLKHIIDRRDYHVAGEYLGVLRKKVNNDRA